MQGRHEVDIETHKATVEKNNVSTQAELDQLNKKWNLNKKSLSEDEKFRRNALKRTILSRGRRIGLKCDEQVCIELLEGLYADN